jgi:hydroxyacylglutathione hydrolase
MLVAGFPAGAWGTNCYVLSSGPGQECLVIDPGQDSMDGVTSVMREHRLKPVAVLLTHGHIDHVWCAAPLTGSHGIAAYIHPGDRYRLADPAGSSAVFDKSALLAMTKGALELTEPDDVRDLPSNGAIELAGLALTVGHAPGHTEGSCVFIRDADDQSPPVMFSGDLLFAGSIGRTDLPGGDHAAMLRSLASVVLTQPDDMVVLPGHGQQTTIGAERATNPFLRDLGGAPAPARGL